MRTLHYATFVTILVFAAPSCNETLPPRVHPYDTNPSEYLDITFDFGGLTVYVGESDLVPSFGGAFLVTARNIHDEVLEGPADIQIDIESWSISHGGPTMSVHGDSSAVRNRYNFNANQWMLDNGIFILEPDSIANFLLFMDHPRYRLWDVLNPRPIEGFSGVTTDRMAIKATGTFTLFKNTLPADLGEIGFDLRYQFHFASQMYAENLQVRVGSDSLVHLTWATPGGEGPDLIGWNIQKGTHGITYYGITDGFRLNYGDPFLGASYAHTDLSSEYGTWFYRLAEQASVGPYAVEAITGYLDGPPVFVP